MIVTLTCNPSIDRTIALDGPLVPGEVQQALSMREDAGGKGVNVARVLHGSGAEVCAVLPLSADDPYRALLGDGLDVRAVPIHSPARANVTLTDPAGGTTKINLPGAHLDERAVVAIGEAVVQAADGADWLALCGSLPPGAPDDLYARIVAGVCARLDGVSVAVDASGIALAEALRPGGIDLIKPNEEELIDAVAALHGDEPAALAAAVAASPVEAVAALARRLVPECTSAALVTLGRHGAVLVTVRGAWHAEVPDGVRVRSTVGAGDSSLAGYLLAPSAEPEQRLRMAVRYGSATASLPGTQLATPGDLPTADIPIRALT
ncbi:MAG: hexose kinase [Microbacterium sp.]